MNIPLRSRMTASILMAGVFLGVVGCKTANLPVNSAEKARARLYSSGHLFKKFHEYIMGDAGNSMVGLVGTYVDTHFRGEDIEITVVACTNANCKTGVKHLRNKEWYSAIANFRKAVADQPSDHCSHFGNGVSHELIADRRLASREGPFLRFSREGLIILQANYEAALVSYRQACAILEEPPSRYSASRDRAEEKLRLVHEAINGKFGKDSP